MAKWLFGAAALCWFVIALYELTQRRLLHAIVNAVAVVLLATAAALFTKADNKPGHT